MQGANDQITMINNFAALQALDKNGDGKINSSDSAYSQLHVWQDTNNNGVVDPGELQSLSQLGIVSINLSIVNVADIQNNGNYITQIATYTTTSGKQNLIADVNLTADNINTYNKNGYGINSNELSLPWLRGYGNVPDLAQAMSQNSNIRNICFQYCFSNKRINSL